MHPPVGPWNPAASQPEADAYNQQHQTPQWQMNQAAQQPGGILADVQRRQDEEMAGIRAADHAARGAAGYPHAGGQSAPGLSSKIPYGRAPVFPPGPVPVDYKTNPPRWPQIVAPTRPAYTPPPTPNAVSVHPGVGVVVALVVVAVLGALGNAAFKRIAQVTPSQMGIATASAVIWTPVPELSSTYHRVEFRITTTNSSDEVRKMKFCARKYSDAPDVCVTYKVPPNSTSELSEKRAVEVERDGDVLAGPLKRVVKVDGHYVTD